MVHTDARFSAAVEQAVTEIEGRTDAEVVVVAAPSSGPYGDVAWAAALVSAVATLAFLCWSPVVFDAWWFPLDVAGSALLVGAAFARFPAISVRLAGDARRRRQVAEAAQAAFTAEKVYATAGRTGLLVYVSALEGRVELLPDEGLLAKIPGAEWNGLRMTADNLDDFVAGLHRVGTLLAQRAPATGDNPDQIPNAPRVRA